VKHLLIISLIGVIFTGCSPKEEIYFDLPFEFRSVEKRAEFIQRFTPHLQGKKIFIDPGHGGKDRASAGPNKLITEADANLRVSLALRDFLKEAGATVIMSRETDSTVELRERSKLANESGADIFVSVHHNAPGSTGDRLINYVSTYYHGKETDFVYEPSERDMAKFIQRDLAYAMRQSGGLGSFDGTYSDYWIYPGSGFSVLRHTEIPAVLVECSFFTHPIEEKRLSMQEYNRVQAWGIFRGIARYFSLGIPKIVSIEERSTFPQGDLNFKYLLVDSSGINPNSLLVSFDSLRTNNYNFNEETGLLDISISDVEPGEYLLRIIAANKNGNHTFPFHKKIVVIK
jgi:N-acetylmuramoyl-L-alanine amidase